MDAVPPESTVVVPIIPDSNGDQNLGVFDSILRCFHSSVVIFPSACCCLPIVKKAVTWERCQTGLKKAENWQLVARFNTLAAYRSAGRWWQSQDC
jgi:hypothetical protein